MKKLSFLLIIFSFIVAGSAFAQKGLDVKIKGKESTAVWTGRKVTGEHKGNISITSGSLKTNGTQVTGGEFVIDMNSITCTDISDAEYNKKLVGHLKNEDFFNTAKFPTANFKIKSVTPIANAAAGQPNATITGELTIKGITKTISFPAVVGVNKGKVTASANIKVDRTLFDIKYGSGSFFDNLGDKAIDNEFELAVTLVAGK